MKKYLSLILALLLCFTLCPAVRAEDEPPAAAAVPAEHDYSYDLLEDGTAQITGYRGNDSNLSIPSGLGGIQVTRIGDYAFYGCTDLTSVTIPDSVIELGAKPFIGCEKLTAFTVSPEHPALAVIEGVLFEKATKTLICYPMGKAQSSYAIPQGIQCIGEGAFYKCQNLNGITIPDSVTTIGDSAFFWCTGLTDVIIPDSVTAIGNDGFGWCSNLTTVTIPDSVVSLGSNPFQDCKNLTTIQVSPEHPTLALIDGVLFEKATKTLICYPKGKAQSSYAIPQGIRWIGAYAFLNCGLTSITIPDSVAAIGDCAFYRCSSLTSITIPDSVMAIGDMAFSACTGLTSVTIPDSVMAIGLYAFSECPKLTVTVGHNSYALQYCKRNEIPYIYPDSLDWLNN